jgi:hypothetical protein
MYEGCGPINAGVSAGVVPSVRIAGAMLNRSGLDVVELAMFFVDAPSVEIRIGVRHLDCGAERRIVLPKLGRAGPRKAA